MPANQKVVAVIIIAHTIGWGTRAKTGAASCSIMLDSMSDQHTSKNDWVWYLNEWKEDDANKKTPHKEMSSHLSDFNIPLLLPPELKVTSKQ